MQAICLKVLAYKKNAVHACQADPIRPSLLDLVHEAGNCKGDQRHFKVSTGEFFSAVHLQNFRGMYVRAHYVLVQFFAS